MAVHSESVSVGLPSSLEYSQNVVTDDSSPGPTAPLPADPPAGVLELAKCGCDCWYCADCCTRRGYNLRAELIPRLEGFRARMMLTLTVDPLLFPSPALAYLHIRESRAISKLMQDLDRGGWLHSRRYFYVLEFQRDTEQAHFHVLVDADYIPKSAIDTAWSKNRPGSVGPPAAGRPAFGICRFSAPRFADAVHAARYVTKYLVKTPDHGWPAWVMAMGTPRRLPRYGTSRGFWNRPAKVTNPAGETREAQPRTYAQRVAGCGESCNIFRRREVVDVRTGEVRDERRFLARVGVNAGVIEFVEQLPGGNHRRATLIPLTLSGAIEVLQTAAGHPVRVIAGIDPGGGS